MKSLLLAVAVILLAASSGSRGLHLEEELKRPEAQKAMENYLHSHCRFSVEPGDTVGMENEYQRPARVDLYCWQDTAPEAQ